MFCWILESTWFGTCESVQSDEFESTDGERCSIEWQSGRSQTVCCCQSGSSEACLLVVRKQFFETRRADGWVCSRVQTRRWQPWEHVDRLFDLATWDVISWSRTSVCSLCDGCCETRMCVWKGKQTKIDETLQNSLSFEFWVLISLSFSV